MKVKFGGQIIKKFFGLRAKTYSYVKKQRRRQKKKRQKNVSKTENLNLRIIITI